MVCEVSAGAVSEFVILSSGLEGSSSVSSSVTSSVSGEHTSVITLQARGLVYGIARISCVCSYGVHAGRCCA